MSAAEPLPQIASARPEMTAAIMAETGLDEDVLRDLVHSFYDKVRRDAVLGPIFAARIADWGPHLERMVTFWSSVALMTGRYHGRPVPAHTPLPINRRAFRALAGIVSRDGAGSLHTRRCRACHRARRTHRPLAPHRGRGGAGSP